MEKAMHHDDHMDALRYMLLHFNKKEDKKMADNNLKTWTDDRANDILKAAYELQNLCKKIPVDCRGCPFRMKHGLCVFKANPAPPHEWNIEENTVYTVKLPDA